MTSDDIRALVIQQERADRLLALADARLDDSWQEDDQDYYEPSEEDE